MSKFEDGSYGSLTGVALIAKVLAGRCGMKYTRVAVGNGTIPDGMTPKTMTGCAGYVMDARIAGVTNPMDGECQVTVQIRSNDVEKGFYATNLVLFADDPDEGEVPYTYLSLENEPEWIRPASSIVGKLATFDLIAAVGDVDTVSAVIDPEAIATVARVNQMLQGHNADLTAHAAQRHVVATRPRDPGKPDYGMGGGGEDGGESSVALETGPYTGETETGVVVNGVLYDAKNMSTRGDTAPDGTILIKTEEKGNG